jgi:hypothetical protein
MIQEFTMVSTQESSKLGSLQIVIMPEYENKPI